MKKLIPLMVLSGLLVAAAGISKIRVQSPIVAEPSAANADANPQEIYQNSDLQVDLWRMKVGNGEICYFNNGGNLASSATISCFKETP